MAKNKHKGAASLSSFFPQQKIHASLKGPLLLWSTSPFRSQIKQKRATTGERGYEFLSFAQKASFPDLPSHPFKLVQS